MKISELIDLLEKTKIVTGNAEITGVMTVIKKRVATLKESLSTRDSFDFPQAVEDFRVIIDTNKGVSR